jgi:hypothetical protein
MGANPTLEPLSEEPSESTTYVFAMSSNASPDSVYASYPALAERLKSKDGTDLLDLVESIDRLRTRLGFIEPNSLCRRFLDYRRKRGSNDLGEPKLAAKFLAEIEQDEKKTEGLRVDNPIEV